MAKCVNIEKIENGFVMEVERDYPPAKYKVYHNNFSDVIHDVYAHLGPAGEAGFIGFLEANFELVPAPVKAEGEEHKLKDKLHCDACGGSVIAGTLRHYKGKWLCQMCYEKREEPK